MTTSECKKVPTLKKMCYFLYYTSDWFKHQIIKKSSSSNMYINLLFSKQIPYNKILSDRV